MLEFEIPVAVTITNRRYVFTISLGSRNYVYANFYTEPEVHCLCIVFKLTEKWRISKHTFGYL